MSVAIAATATAAPKPAAHATSADHTLRALFAEEWSDRMRDDRVYATQAGVRDYDDQLPSVRLAGNWHLPPAGLPDAFVQCPEADLSADVAAP